MDNKSKVNVEAPPYGELMDAVAELQRQVESLQKNRLHQSDIPAGTIKQIHVGEGVIFIRSGLDASKPTTGEQTKQGQPLYWATDTNKLYIWNGAAWKSATLS